MKTAGSIHAFHALAAFLVVVLRECVSVKDESLLLSNQLDDDDDNDDDDVNDAEVNEKNDMRCLSRKHSCKSSKRSKSSKRHKETSMSAAERTVKNFGKKFHGSIAQVLSSSGPRFRAIYPGTLWCGDGDIAKNLDHLGIFKKTDACCRDHDHCPEYMAADQSKYGLRNGGIFTRSHCDCDLQFYNCLKDARSPVSYQMGYTYFNLLRPQCYKNDYPAKCAKYAWPEALKTRCVRYSFDTRKPKKWQWFDNPEY